MLGLPTSLLLFAALGDAAALPRRDEPSPEVKKALEDAGVDVSKQTTSPKNKVEQVLSIGDSYSAGIGSNHEFDEWGETNCSRYDGAWPVLLSKKDEWKDFGKDGQKPSLTFGPCSGNVMVDVREKMLEQGEPKDTHWMDYSDWPYTPIGKPQIAVMTISGNDINFSGIVNDCIFRYYPKMGCSGRLKDSRRILESPDFKQDLRLTYAKVIAAGREAGGADPPESFQLYVGGYIGLFNHDDGDCDHVFWNVAYGWFAYKQWLTTSLRWQFNDLLGELNGIIKSVAEELEPWGVIHVDGYDEHFNDHRFCEHREPKCIHDRSHQDNDVDTKIWSYQSPFALRGSHVPNDDEGFNRSKICTKSADSEQAQADAPDDSDIFERIADVLVPNPEERQKMRDDPNLAPWNVSDINPDQYDDVFAMMQDRIKLHDDPADAWNDYDSTYRMFHPKKSGYQFFANSWMDAIAANRKEEEAPSAPPEAPQPTKALTIVFESKYDHTDGEAPDWVTLWFKRTWLFYEHNLGDPVGCFDRANAWQFDESMSETKDNMPDWPANPEINDAELSGPSVLPQGCGYMSDGTNAGRLFCPDFPGGSIGCKESPDRTKPETTFECPDEARRRYAVDCEW